MLVLCGLVRHPALLTAPTVAARQADATDADLEKASAGRTVALGAASGGGRVAVVPLEVYVARVIAGEGEPNAPEATQQALAIAIRTFAVVNSRRHARDGFDLCDGTHCQVPRAATIATRQAALTTAGRVLTYNGSPAEVFYSASCGGQSESASSVWPGADLPYLRSVFDDVHADDTPWTLSLTLREIREALGRVGFTGALTNVEVEARSESGRASRLRLSGLRPDTIAGDAFRLAVGASAFRSTAFAIERTGDTLRFTGRGYGHGVGMCVVGAGRRARRGESVDQILRAYYPGLQLAVLQPGTSSLSTTILTPASVDTVAASEAVPSAERPRAADPVRPAIAASAAATPRRDVTVSVPTGALINARELEARATRALDDIGTALGTSTVALSLTLRESTESFRAATGRPWWFDWSLTRGTIELAPSAVLGDADNLDRTIRIAVAELLMSPVLADRPMWVRVGGARYVARAGGGGRGIAIAASPRNTRSGVRCPSDVELTLAISAAAQREAEARAEACFARAYQETLDWRAVK